NERARVDALDAGDVVARQVVAERLLRPPARRGLAVLAPDEASHPGLPRLDVLAVDADVPDLGIRHRDELPLVRGVGQDLLVARHAGVEDELAGRLGRGAERLAVEDRAVGECEDCGTPAHASAPSPGAGE